MWVGLKPVEFEESKSELESSGIIRQKEHFNFDAFILRSCGSLHFRGFFFKNLMF